MKKALDKWKWSTKLIINWQRTAQSTAIHCYGKRRRTATPPKAPTRSTIRRQRASSGSVGRANSHSLESSLTTFPLSSLSFCPLSNQITWSHSHFAVGFAFAVVALKYQWRDRSLGQIRSQSEAHASVPHPNPSPHGEQLVIRLLQLLLGQVKEQVQSSHSPPIRTSV